MFIKQKKIKKINISKKKKKPQINTLETSHDITEPVITCKTFLNK